MQLDPALLPDLVSLRRRAKALAVLDAIMSPEWDYRWFSFNASWGDHEQMASMRNGQGDEWFILFGPFGAAVKGFDHESPVGDGAELPTAIQNTLPTEFATFLSEPAFSMDQASFCYWRAPRDARWSQVKHPDARLSGADDGSAEYLRLLIEPADAYVEFAGEYYEQELALTLVQQVYAHAPITDQLVNAINPKCSHAEAIEAAAEAGYPEIAGAQP
jgi:hypothetical protein